MWILTVYKGQGDVNMGRRKEMVEVDEFSPPKKSGEPARKLCSFRRSRLSGRVEFGSASLDSPAPCRPIRSPSFSRVWVAPLRPPRRDNAP